MADYTGWRPADETLPDEIGYPYDVLTEDGQILEMVYAGTPACAPLWLFNGRISPWKVAAWKPNSNTYTESEDT